MSRIKVFLISCMSLISFSMAQSPIGELSAVETRIDRDVSEINLQMPINVPINNGFYVELPTDAKMVPLSINLSGKEFWLKKTKEIPTNANVVHWDFDDGNLVFLFAEGVLITEENLNILFQALGQKDQEEPRTLVVRSLEGNGPQNFQAGDVQSRVQLVQTEK